MVADLDVRDLHFPLWARVGVLIAALLNLGLGIAMLVGPQWPLFEAVNAEKLVWQAVGILETAIGAGLVAAFRRPTRNAGLMGAGFALELAGIVALVCLVAAGASEVGSVPPLLGAKVAGAGLLLAALIAVRRAPEVGLLSAEPRPGSSSTLFGLQQTLQALAAPASIQLTMFPDLVVNGERVMAEFQQWRERALQKQDALSPQQRDALTGLEQCLQAMSNGDATQFWNGDAVRTAPEWGRLRAAARRALVSFAWSVDMPMGVLKRRREGPGSVDMRPPSTGLGLEGERQRARGSSTKPESHLQ